MSGSTYVYLSVCLFFLLLAGVLAGIAISKERAANTLRRENYKISNDYQDVKWHLERQAEEIRDLTAIIDGTPRKKRITGTNTDYLIQEEELV